MGTWAIKTKVLDARQAVHWKGYERKIEIEQNQRASSSERRACWNPNFMAHKLMPRALVLFCYFLLHFSLGVSIGIDRPCGAHGLETSKNLASSLRDALDQVGAQLSHHSPCIAPDRQHRQTISILLCSLRFPNKYI